MKNIIFYDADIFVLNDLLLNFLFQKSRSERLNRSPASTLRTALRQRRSYLCTCITMISHGIWHKTCAHQCTL